MSPVDFAAIYIFQVLSARRNVFFLVSGINVIIFMSWQSKFLMGTKLIAYAKCHCKTEKSASARFPMLCEKSHCAVHSVRCVVSPDPEFPSVG